MSGFKFDSTKIEIEIEGRKYPVNFGDPELQQEILEFSLELANTPLDEKRGEIYEWVHKRVHYYVGALLGEDAEQEIFAGREPSAIEDLLLFAYLQEQINQTAAMQALVRNLGRLAPAMTK
jgi:hypothetical protein